MTADNKHRPSINNSIRNVIVISHAIKPFISKLKKQGHEDAWFDPTGHVKISCLMHLTNFNNYIPISGKIEQKVCTCNTSMENLEIMMRMELSCTNNGKIRIKFGFDDDAMIK